MSVYVRVCMCLSVCDHLCAVGCMCSCFVRVCLRVHLRACKRVPTSHSLNTSNGVVAEMRLMRQRYENGTRTLSGRSSPLPGDRCPPLRHHTMRRVVPPVMRARDEHSSTRDTVRSTDLLKTTRCRNNRTRKIASCNHANTPQTVRFRNFEGLC